MNRQARKGRGFSLIELVVAIAILMIVVVAVPALKSSAPKQRARNAAWGLASDLNWARGRAITEQNPYIVSFDEANSSYSIYDDNGKDGIDPADLVRSRTVAESGSGVVFGFVAGDAAGGGPIEHAVQMGETESPVRQVFQPSGIAAYSGVLYLIHSSDLEAGDAGGQVAVAVYRTGKIRVWERARQTGSWH